MPDGRVPARRKDLTVQWFPALLGSDYGQLDGGAWCVCPPGGYPAIASNVTVHEDGTITAEVKQGGQKHRIVRGVWEPPTPA
jgi:hypothetical protein